MASPLGHAFKPDSWGRDVCDALTDEDGRPRHCGRPRHEHQEGRRTTTSEAEPWVEALKGVRDELDAKGIEVNVDEMLRDLERESRE